MMNIPSISGFEFEKQAALDASVNLISTVITPWHAICLDAAIRYLESKGESIKGMVMIAPHVCSGINVDERCFLKGKYDLYLRNDAYTSKVQKVQCSRENSLHRFFKKRMSHLQRFVYVLFGGINWAKRKEIYVLDCIYPNCQLGRKLLKYGRFARHVVVDDGFISYYPHIWETVPQKSVFCVSEWAGYFRDVVVEHRWIFRFHTVVSALIFKKKGNALCPNDAVIPFFRLVLQEHSASDSRFQGLDLTNSVVIATGTHLEEKERYHDEDLRVWENVCNLLHERGYTIYLKPHPRDTFFKDYAPKLHAILLEDIENASIEDMCNKAKPVCIMGFPSNAIITPKLFFDIPTIGVFDLMDVSKCSEKAIENISTFKSLFSHLISIPKSLDELDGLMSGLHS